MLLGRLSLDCAPGGYYTQPTLHARVGVVFACEGDLWLVEEDTTGAGSPTPRRLTTDGSCSSPLLSPDGRLLAYACGKSGGGADVYVMPSDGGRACRLTFLGDAKALAWARDGAHVVFASGQGPFQYSVPKLAAFVKAQLGE